MKRKLRSKEEILRLTQMIDKQVAKGDTIAQAAKAVGIPATNYYGWKRSIEGRPYHCKTTKQKIKPSMITLPASPIKEEPTGYVMVMDIKTALRFMNGEL